jgi:hypothetical protein
MPPPNDPGLKGLLDLFTTPFKSRVAENGTTPQTHPDPLMNWILKRFRIVAVVTVVFLYALSTILPSGSGDVIAAVIIFGFPVFLLVRTGKYRRRERAIENASPLETGYYRDWTGKLQPYVYGNPDVRPPSPVVRPSGEHGTARFQGADDLAAAGFVDDGADNPASSGQAQADAATATKAINQLHTAGWTVTYTPSSGTWTLTKPGEGVVSVRTLRELVAIGHLAATGQV